MLLYVKVLGLQHLAVATRDVALYMPFRITLSTDRVIGLQTLMWHFMARQIQRQAIISPVRHRLRPLFTHLYYVYCSSRMPARRWTFTAQLHRTGIIKSRGVTGLVPYPPAPFPAATFKYIVCSSSLSLCGSQISVFLCCFLGCLYYK